MASSYIRKEHRRHAYNQIMIDRINMIINYNDISGAELARRIGVDRRIVYWWLGGGALKHDDIINICKKFNVSADWLLGISDIGGIEWTN